LALSISIHGALTPRDLHSFPTRRSSDLELAGHSPAFDANLANAYAASGRTTDARRTAADLEHLPEQSGSLDANIAMIYVGLGDTDRKSTRLNSSHVSISYAVFCLKKKTK